MKTIVVRGKTQITDFMFMLNLAKMIVDGELTIPIKIFYFSLEMTAEEKMLSCFANILSVKADYRISPTDLKSTRRDNPLPEKVLKLIQEYLPYFQKIEEIVEFIDDVRTGYGMFDLVRGYMESNGTMHYKDLTFTSKDEEGNLVETVHKVRDFYDPYDPEKYTLVIIDHISLISPESRNKVKMDLRDSIGILSSDYLLRLRNIYGVTPVVIQQQASSQESVENKKANKLKPSLDGLGENKATQRDEINLVNSFRFCIFVKN